MDLFQGFVLDMRSLGMGSGGLVSRVCNLGKRLPTGKPSGKLKRISDAAAHGVELYV